jgi:methyltransferase (TIGR00027 family)
VQAREPEKTIMPSHLKDLVRARMDKTGESYEQALRHVRAQEQRAPEPAPVGAGEAPYIESAERAASVADTAFVIAAVRAEESARPERERLFDDPYAAMFLAAGAHAAEAVQRFMDLPGLREGIRIRTRFIDDAVRDGLAASLDQVLLFGAGFDARGLRMPEIAARGARVFEVDTAAQLDRKCAVLANAGVKVPANLAFVPCDFHATSMEVELPAALAAQGFRLGGGAVVVWEGVIGYIDDGAIQRTLDFVVKHGGPRSRLVFTYADGSFGKESAAERIRRAGFRSLEEASHDVLWRRLLHSEPRPEASVIMIGVAFV